VPKSACQADLAFVAVSGSFVEPTPRELALGLNELTFGTRPIAFVLSGAVADASLAASYTLGEDGIEAFPSGLVPPPTSAWIDDSGFGTLAAQEEGWLLATLDEGPLEVPLRNIAVTATTNPTCTSGTATLTAAIPADHADLVAVLSLEPDVEVEPDEEEEDRGSVSDVQLRGVFVIELVDFDPGGLP
jgi:hypothetical protein